MKVVLTLLVNSVKKLKQVYQQLLCTKKWLHLLEIRLIGIDSRAKFSSIKIIKPITASNHTIYDNKQAMRLILGQKFKI